VALTLPHPPGQHERVTPPEPTSSPGPSPPRRRAGDRKGRAFFDNTKLILLGIAALVGTLAGLLALANRSASLTPDFLAEFVLYALSATDLTILVALVFVLARNIVKLLVERRRALPFARFPRQAGGGAARDDVHPAVLVLIVGSELIRNSVDRWFNAPMEQVLESAQGIAADYYQEQQRVVSSFSLRLSRRLGPLDVASADPAAVQAAVQADEPPDHVEIVEVFSVASPAASRRGSGRSRGCRRRACRPAPTRARRRWPSAPRRRGPREHRGSAGERRRADSLREADSRQRAGPVRGVVIASHYLPRDFVARARGMTSAFEGYQQLRVLKGPGDRRLCVVLPDADADDSGGRHVDGAVHGQAHHAPGTGACHGRARDRSRPPGLPRGDQSHDEFGSLAEAFNVMAGDLATSRAQLERSAGGPRAPALRRREPAPLRGDRPRTHRHRRAVGGRGRAHPHRELGGAAPARSRFGRVGSARGRRVQRAGAQARWRRSSPTAPPRAIRARRTFRSRVTAASCNWRW
jgi:two-component system nitrogen regulation sensor histidine kinase NtrY